jgi:hypothetical protein
MKNETSCSAFSAESDILPIDLIFQFYCFSKRKTRFHQLKKKIKSEFDSLFSVFQIPIQVSKYPIIPKHEKATAFPSIE